MIGETGERKSAVATPDGKCRKKKKKNVPELKSNLLEIIISVTMHFNQFMAIQASDVFMIFCTRELFIIILQKCK